MSYVEEWAAKLGYYAWLPTIDYMLVEVVQDMIRDELMWLIPRGLGDEVATFWSQRWSETR